MSDWSSPLYHTPEALRAVGPQAFGYELPFVALATGAGAAVRRTA